MNRIEEIGPVTGEVLERLIRQRQLLVDYAANLAQALETTEELCREGRALLELCKLVDAPVLPSAADLALKTLELCKVAEEESKRQFVEPYLGYSALYGDLAVRKD